MIAKRDKAAARFYFDKPTRDNGAPEKNMDKCGANQAAIDEINVARTSRSWFDK
ncbi:hypothetical protein ACFS07_03950 [Undibacterium arcticum]